MRLEHDDDPAAAGHVAGGGQVGGQLGRVVGVAVVDPDAGGGALVLEPAPGAGEGRQPLAQPLEREAQPEPGGQRGRGVEHVVPAGQPQLDRAEPPAAQHGLERRCRDPRVAASTSRRSASGLSP